MPILSSVPPSQALPPSLSQKRAHGKLEEVELSYREGLLLPGNVSVPVTPVIEKLFFLTVIDPHDLSAGGLDEVLELTELIHSLKGVFLQGIPEMRSHKHRNACAGWRRGSQEHSIDSGQHVWIYGTMGT